MANEFGEFLRSQRLKAGYSLRAFAKEIKMKPSNLSFIETGKANPPRAFKKLSRIASVLQLKKDSKNWNELFDLSANESEIPVDIAANENIRQYLPIMLRSVANARLSKKELEKLIATIKKTERKK